MAFEVVGKFLISFSFNASEEALGLRRWVVVNFQEKPFIAPIEAYDNSMHTFANKVEFPVSIGQPSKASSWRGIIKCASIIKFNFKNSFIITCATIDGQVHLGLDAPGNRVAPSLHHEGCNGWVMGNLFEVDRAVVDPALIGFA